MDNLALQPHLGFESGEQTLVMGGFGLRLLPPPLAIIIQITIG